MTSTSSSLPRSWEKPAAIIIASLAAVFLAMRVFVSAQRHGSWSAAFHFLSHFFTILTNNRVMIIMGQAATATEKPSTNLLLSNVASILIVGLVYHTLLAHLIQLPPGILPWLSDHGVHTVVPILTLGWWLAYERRVVPYSAVLHTLPWPLVYSIYVLVRAKLLGGNFYPYPFLDLKALGWPKFLANVVGLGIGFATMGSILVAINRAIWKKDSSKKVSSKDNKVE